MGEHGNESVSERRNRLAGETSPYLLQHAANPVDWFPWGEEALNKAKAEDKPIFLSIGYSACHWCHVMERESFENDAIAEVLNQHFVSIKVDREERPDLDEIYMAFVQASTGSGGWPMSVFLTPDGKPFFGGTYFPPEANYGRPGFQQILKAVAEAWMNDRQSVLEHVDSIVTYLRATLAQSGEPGAVATESLDRAREEMLAGFDPINGGFGGAPKFPPSYALSFLMRQYHRSKGEQTLRVVTHTLDKMAAGGVYDQLGGGFHRYSVDARWLVPHFEKMLYDNALLSVTYLEAYQLTAGPAYLKVAEGILNYVLRDLSDSAGGFQSAEDADSEGVEGKFYVWRPEEIVAVLGAEDGRLFCDYYGVTDRCESGDTGSILHVCFPERQFAERYQLTKSELEARLASLRKRLLSVRDKRVRPRKDDKVLCDWNGLMISAFAKGYQITEKHHYLAAAVRCARFVESKMMDSGELMHAYCRGRAKQSGFLTDYAFFANAMVDLYEAAFDVHWLQLADTLAQEMITRFGDSTAGGFFMTQPDQADLLVRPKQAYDGAVPSGGSVAAMVLARLGALLDRQVYRDLAQGAIAALADSIAKAPLAHLNLLNAHDFVCYPPGEVVFVGNREESGTRKLIRQLHVTYLPNKVVALLDPANTDNDGELIPLLKGRILVENKSAAYVCWDSVCKPPVNSAEALARLLVEEKTS